MTRGRTGVRAQVWVAATTAVLAALLFVACGGGSGHTASAPAPGTAAATTSTTLPDVAPTPADFVNINTMTRVGDHFVGSLNGHLAAALAIARSAHGGVYPVGTVLQLIPTEAMVKRRKGYSPATRDWEFFSPKVSPQGTRDPAFGREGEELPRSRLRVLPPGGATPVRLRLREDPRLRAARESPTS